MLNKVMRIGRLIGEKYMRMGYHMPNTYTLTKTKYIKGLKCIKALWLDTYARKEAIVSPETQAKFGAGRSFEAKFKATFPNSVDLMENLGKKISEYVPATAKLLHDNDVVTIFEAAFIFEKTLVLTDVLQKQRDCITIFEVKNNSKLKNVFLQDLFVQYFVTHSVLGDRLQSFNIVLNGDDSDFKILDVTDVLKHNKETVLENINVFNTVISNTTCPKIKMDVHCNSPYECEFQLYCKNAK